MRKAPQLAPFQHPVFRAIWLASLASNRGLRRSLTFNWQASAEALRGAYEHAIALRRSRHASFSRLS